MTSAFKTVSSEGCFILSNILSIDLRVREITQLCVSVTVLHLMVGIESHRSTGLVGTCLVLVPCICMSHVLDLTSGPLLAADSAFLAVRLSLLHTITRAYQMLRDGFTADIVASHTMAIKSDSECVAHCFVDLLKWSFCQGIFFFLSQVSLNPPTNFVLKQRKFLLTTRS